MQEIEDCIAELYREAEVSRTAMLAMLYGNVSSMKTELRRMRANYAAQDSLAGHRMAILMDASWMESKFLKQNLEFAQSSRLGIEPTSRVQDATTAGMTRTQARTYSSVLEAFVIGDEGPGLFGVNHFWLAEDEVIHKLRMWMIEVVTPRVLWISSPYDTSGTTSARAASLATVAAAWQAETPLISHFCQRPQLDKLRAEMSIEQVGLVGMVYSLICQLLQFSDEENELDVGEERFAALNGTSDSWNASLEVLRALLDRTYVSLYCVIDGLNDLEWSNGSEWCGQFLNVLLTRQQREGPMFNILLTTTGQSRVLSSCVKLEDRHFATKRAREVARVGRRIDLHPLGQRGPVS
jgi:hypothetical protein